MKQTRQIEMEAGNICGAKEGAGGGTKRFRRAGNVPRNINIFISFHRMLPCDSMPELPRSVSSCPVHLILWMWN